ncbi:MAG: 2-nitropropane dioxygenase [Glaciihabitans sp.]|nr:2-nitropropane dioxygenase [Glaciihabitans sp.]
MTIHLGPTPATELFGVALPVVLGPFGGTSSVALTAAVSNAGGLGSFGLYGYGAERIASTAAALRSGTDKPFALNLWLPLREVGEPDTSPGPTVNSNEISADPFGADGFAAARDRLAPFFAELGLPLPERPERYLPDFDEQFEAVLAAKPAVLSFVFGVPSARVVERAHERGIVVVGAATTVEEAVALQDGGVDAVVASGMEAGGHRISFLRPAEESLIGTFALVPQVADAISLPVVAAGGIADGRGLAAARILGADAVQVGSALLATEESAATPAYRAALRSDAAGHTVLTRAASGRLARGIPNRFIREVEAAGTVAPFPVQNWLTGVFRAVAAERGDAELMSLWAGQATPLVQHTSAADMIAAMVHDATALLG